MNIIQRGEDITILNDTYNANPPVHAGRRWRCSPRPTGHRRSPCWGICSSWAPWPPPSTPAWGTYLGKAGIDCLVAVGELARNIYDAAAEAKVPEVHYCATKQEALPVLAQVVKPHATILVKASRGMAFEDLTEYLKSITQEP